MNDSADSEFKRFVGAVTPVRSDRVNLLADKPRPARPNRQTSLTRSGDELNPVFSASATATETYFAPGLQRKLQARIRSGTIRPQASLDLHGLRLVDATVELQQFITDATKQALRMLLVIHGQGYGSSQQPVLKPMVFQQLAERRDVLAWCPAQCRDGAGGATYVYLKGK